MKTILLTGANGFIGKNIQALLGERYHIISVTRESKYDIMNLNSLLEIANVDVVIHTAAKTFVPDSFDNPYEFYKFNIDSTLNIAEYCRIKKIKNLIYLNSYAYGSPNYLPIDEKHPVSFHSPYNKSKFIAEELLFNYLSDITNVISLRLFNIYGKYQSDNFLIPEILKQIKGNNEIKVKDLEPKRDFIYVKDLVFLIDKIINSDNKNGIYNIGSGFSYSVEEIIDFIKINIDVDIQVSSENTRRKNEVMDCVADINKVKKDFNWIPKFDLQMGLKDYIGEVYND